MQNRRKSKSHLHAKPSAKSFRKSKTNTDHKNRARHTNFNSSRNPNRILIKKRKVMDLESSRNRMGILNLAYFGMKNPEKSKLHPKVDRFPDEKSLENGE